MSRLSSSIPKSIKQENVIQDNMNSKDTGIFSNQENAHIDINEESATYLQQSSNNSNNLKLIPLVLIEGFLAVNNKWYWGSLEYGFKRSILPDRPIIYVEIGSVSSLHDRACEIFYQIKGGTVDYGEYHSEVYCHNRFGKTYKGLYPEWDSDHPIHIAGYSYGGNTIWYLQQMLDINIFEGHKTSSDWIYSLTGFVAPFMGTPLLEAFGSRPSGVLKGSALDYLLLGIILYEKLKLRDIKNNKLGFMNNIYGQSDNRNKQKELTNKHCISVDLIRLFDKSYRIREDNAAVDMLPHRMQAINTHSTTFKNTYYRTYHKNRAEKPQLKHLIKKFYSAFFLSALSLHFYRPNKLDKNGPLTQHIMESKLSILKLNDGICPTNYCYHPGPCSPDFCMHMGPIPLSDPRTNHVDGTDTNKDDNLSTTHSTNSITHETRTHVRGAWNVIEVDKCTHRSMFPYGSTHNKNPEKTLMKKKIHARVLMDYVQYLTDLDMEYNYNKLDAANTKANTSDVDQTESNFLNAETHSSCVV